MKTLELRVMRASDNAAKLVRFLSRHKKVSSEAVFLAHMPAGGLSFDPAGRDQLNFDFTALAYDKDGKEAGQSSLSFTRPVPQDQLASVRANGVDFRNALALAPGKYTVRFVVRDNVTGKVGSVTAPLTVN
jgi:hypothetical protein